MPVCSCTSSCCHCSNTEAGRVPTVGLPSSDESSKYSAGPTPVLVPIFCPRRAAFAVSTLGYEWWDTVASTTAVECCSCRHHERSRRCFRCCAALTRAAMGFPPRVEPRGDAKKGTLESNAFCFCGRCFGHGLEESPCVCPHDAAT